MKKAFAVILAFLLMASSVAFAQEIVNTPKTEAQKEMLHALAETIQQNFPETDSLRFYVQYNDKSDQMLISVVQKSLTYEEYRKLCQYGNDFLKDSIDLSRTLYDAISNQVAMLGISTSIIVSQHSSEETVCFIILNGSMVGVQMDLIFFD